MGYERRALDPTCRARGDINQMIAACPIFVFRRARGKTKGFENGNF